MFVPATLEQTVLRLRNEDADYQALLEQICSMSEEYFRILERLPEADREFLRQYQALSEQLDDRTVCLVATHYAINGTNALQNTTSPKASP